jgi:hypothetical protein
MSNDTENSICPYCKETIKPDAIKCKHCHSELPVTSPSHKGTCPFCKEAIKVDAIKCKHCQSILTKKQDCGCGSPNTKDGKDIMKALSRLRLGHHSGPKQPGPWGDWCQFGCTLDWLDCDWETDPLGCSLTEVLCRDSCDQRFKR